MDEELEMQKGTSLLENNSFLQVLQGISANNNVNNIKISSSYCMFYIQFLHSIFIVILQ